MKMNMDLKLSNEKLSQFEDVSIPENESSIINIQNQELETKVEYHIQENEKLKQKLKLM